MNRQVLREIAEMAVNLPIENVKMHCFFNYGAPGCILGHAAYRGILGEKMPQCEEDYEEIVGEDAYWKYFNGTVFLTPKQIGYAILDELDISHV